MKLRHYTIIATLALLAASCAHEESEVAQISDIQLAITAAFATPAADFAAAGVGVGDASATENSAKSAAKAQTKATTTAFESGDMLGLYAVKSGGELNAASNLINNHQLKVAESGAIVGDQLPAYYPDKSSELDLFSYFPYQSGNATADALGVLVGIRTHQTDFSLLQASDLCYGQKLDAAPSAAPHPLQFRHSFAQLRLNFSLYEGCSAIATVKLLSIKDSAKLNLQTGLVTLLTSSIADVEPFVNSADATNPLQFTAIIPSQSLSGACVEITLTDGTIYYYHATSPIALTASATNTLNLTLSDKGKLTLASTPAITAWGVESTISNISESTDNAFTFYWSPAITSFGSINKAFVTLTNPATKKSARIEVTAFVRDATSTAANAIFRFAITRTDAASIGYPVTIDKFELFNGGTAVHTLTDYYGRTVTRSGAHTFGTVTSIKLSPDGDWLGVPNTAQSRSVTIATTGSTSWVASASPSGIGLSVSPASGANSATATIKWAAQAVGSLARNGEVTFKTTPDGVVKVVNTSQLAGPAPTLTLSATSPGETVPKEGGTYTITVSSNTKWWSWSITVGVAINAVNNTDTEVTITVPANTLSSQRDVSAYFANHDLPSGAVASQTWVGTQEAAPANSIYINDRWWATGNLVANGPNSCKIGAPTDGGLYFQFGSLLGWKGGATGDGAGRCKVSNEMYHNGRTEFNASLEVEVMPIEFKKIADIGNVWPQQTTNLYYFGLISYDKDEANLRDFPGFSNGSMAADGVGDPCTHYLGGAWHTPTVYECGLLLEPPSYVIHQGDWTNENSTTSHILITTPNGNLQFEAVGSREWSTGWFYSVGQGGITNSSSVGCPGPPQESLGHFNYYLWYNQTQVHTSSGYIRSRAQTIRCVHY